MYKIKYKPQPEVTTSKEIKYNELTNEHTKLLEEVDNFIEQRTKLYDKWPTKERTELTVEFAILQGKIDKRLNELPHEIYETKVEQEPKVLFLPSDSFAIMQRKEHFVIDIFEKEIIWTNEEPEVTFIGK